MDPIQSGFPLQHPSVAHDSGHLAAPAGDSQAPHSHPHALSLAIMSPNAHIALDQAEAQADNSHQLVAMTARNGILEGMLHYHSLEGEDARYLQCVNMQDMGKAKLWVRARLTDQAQYDIINLHLQLLASDQKPERTLSIHLSGPPAAVMHSDTARQAGSAQAPAPSQLGAYYSASQLTAALARQSGTPGFSNAPLPSGASTSTASMEFSQGGESAAHSSGPSRTQRRNERARPYTTFVHADATGSLPSELSRSRPVKTTKNTTATDDQINAYLKESEGSGRTGEDTLEALRQAGLGVSTSRFYSLSQKVLGAQQFPSATNEQIEEHLRDPVIGKIRTRPDVANALHKAGLGAGLNRIGSVRKNAIGAQVRPIATNEKITALLRNSDGTFRSTQHVLKALHDAELGARPERVRSLLRSEKELQANQQPPNATSGPS